VNWQDGLLLVAKLGVIIFEGIREGLSRPEVIKRARSILGDVAAVDTDVDAVAMRRTRASDVEIE
jgi:hypothetical protein